MKLGILYLPANHNTPGVHLETYFSKYFKLKKKEHNVAEIVGAAICHMPCQHFKNCLMMACCNVQSKPLRYLNMEKLLYVF